MKKIFDFIKLTNEHVRIFLFDGIFEHQMLDSILKILFPFKKIYNIFFTNASLMLFMRKQSLKRKISSPNKKYVFETA